MDDPVAAGREIIVGGVLILVRTSLITFTGALVVIRPRLILITRGLVVIRPRLILIALFLAAINRSTVTGCTAAAGREVAATVRTAGNLGHLAAGWTPHGRVTTVLSRARADQHGARRLAVPLQWHCS